MSWFVWNPRLCQSDRALSPTPSHHIITNGNTTTQERTQRKGRSQCKATSHTEKAKSGSIRLISDRKFKTDLAKFPRKTSHHDLHIYLFQSCMKPEGENGYKIINYNDKKMTITTKSFLLSLTHTHTQTQTHLHKEKENLYQKEISGKSNTLRKKRKNKYCHGVQKDNTYNTAI